MIHSCGHTCFCFGQTSVRNSNSGYNGESRPGFWILSKIVYLVTKIQCTLLQSHALKNEARMNWWLYGQRPFFGGLFLIISITSADWHVYKKTDDCNWLLIIRGSIWGIWFLSASFWKCARKHVLLSTWWIACFFVLMTREYEHMCYNDWYKQTYVW